MFRSQSWKRFFFEGEWKCKLKPKAMDGFALNYTMERGEMIWWKSTWFFKSFQHHRFLFIFQHTLPEGCLRWSEQTVILWWVVVQIYPNERERAKASVNFGKSWFVFHQRRSKHKVVGLISGKFTVLKPSGLEWEELMSHLLELHRDYSKLTVIDIQRIGNLEILIGCKVTHQVAWIIHFQLPVVDYSLFFFFGEFIFLSRAFFDNAIHIRAAEKDKVCKLISRLNTKSLALLVSCE